MTSETPAAPEPVEIDANGVTLRGLWWAGDSLVVILLHAPGDDHDLDRWRPLIPYLLGTGVSVLAADLRGHGASDGDWAPMSAVGDVGAVVAFARTRAEVSVVCAEGSCCLDVIRSAESGAVDGLVLLSPTDPGGNPPRGAGTPKLLLAGSFDESSKPAVAVLRDASIGPARSVVVPTADSGVGLLTGELAATCREHIVAFLSECRHDRGHVQRLSDASQERALGMMGMFWKPVESKGEER